MKTVVVVAALAIFWVMAIGGIVRRVRGTVLTRQIIVSVRFAVVVAALDSVSDKDTSLGIALGVILCAIALYLTFARPPKSKSARTMNRQYS